MKKSSKKAISTVCVLLALCSVSALALTGCNSNSASTSQTSQTSSTSSEDDTSSSQESHTEEVSSETINMDNYTITLRSLVSTGYSWSYSVDNEGILEDVSAESSAANTQTFSFKGVKEGDVTVTFKYSRPWEEDGDSTVQSVKLHVDADGNIRKQTAKTYTISMDANSSTGYTWSYTANKEGIVKEVVNEYTENSTKTDVTGAGGVQTYSFESESAGNVRLTFKYTSADGESIAEIKDVVLHVDDDGNIIETKKADGNQFLTVLNETSEADWTYSTDKEGIVTFIYDEYVPVDSTSSQNGLHTFVFEGVSEGDVTITFIAKNKTSSDSQITSSEKTSKITIHVDSDGNITL